jgi:hypothetical protein
MCAVVVILSLISQFGCGGLCNEKVQSQVRSPDGNTIATLYVRDCGATTPFTSFVHLRTSSEQLDTSNSDAIVMHLQGTQEIQLHWKSNSVLEIRCTPCKLADIFRKVDNWKRIAVVYLSDDPVGPPGRN